MIFIRIIIWDLGFWGFIILGFWIFKLREEEGKERKICFGAFFWVLKVSGKEIERARD